MDKIDGVDVTLISNKNLPLDTINSGKIHVTLHVFESENPYALIFMITDEYNEQCRFDISKEDIANQLKDWLEGGIVDNACALISKTIEEEIMRYVKFGTPPKPMLLANWLLSRCILHTDPTLVLSLGNNLDESNNKSKSSSVTKNKSMNDSNSPMRTMTNTNFTMSPVSKYKTLPVPESDKFTYAMERSVAKEVKTLNMSGIEAKDKLRKTKATSATSVVLLAQDLMGKSGALKELKGCTVSNKHDDDGRKDSVASSLPFASLTDEHYRLGCEIEKSRKDVENKLEERRRMIEINKARATHLKKKLFDSRTKQRFSTGGNSWTRRATEEVISLSKIQQSIEDDIVRQRSRGLRAVQTVMWTLAPNGCNLGGKSMPGKVIMFYYYLFIIISLLTLMYY